MPRLGHDHPAPDPPRRSGGRFDRDDTRRPGAHVGCIGPSHRLGEEGADTKQKMGAGMDGAHCRSLELSPPAAPQPVRPGMTFSTDSQGPLFTPCPVQEYRHCGGKHRGSLPTDGPVCGRLESLAPAMHGDGCTIPD